MAKERIHWIDIARGIAILCVFFGHTVSTPAPIGVFIYFFHMPLFFVLSGYCFSAERKYKDFLIVKLKTVVLPIFTIGLTGSILVSLLLRFVKHETVDWKWVLLNPIIQLGEHSLLWYLAALFVALNVFYGLVKLLKDKPAVLLTVSFIIGLAAYVYIEKIGVNLPWSSDTACVALPFVAFGYFLKKSDFAEKLGRIWVAIVSFAVCIITGIFNSRYFGGVEMHTNNYGNIFLFYLAAIAGSIMVISFSMLIGKSGLVEYFGRNSLVFYAAEPIQYFANFALKTVSPIINYSASFPVGFAVTIVAVGGITAASSLLSAIINKYFPFLIGQKRAVKGE